MGYLTSVGLDGKPRKLPNFRVPKRVDRSCVYFCEPHVTADESLVNYCEALNPQRKLTKLSTPCGIILVQISCHPCPPAQPAWPTASTRSHYVRNSNRRNRSKTCANVIVSNLEKRDAPSSSRSGTGSVEGKRRRSSFRHISVKFISETRPLQWQKGDAHSYYASTIMQVKEMCVSRGGSPFITKVGASPIPSPITKAHASPFITKAGASPITKARTSPFITKAGASPILYIEDGR
jgi:hypothetical protein